MWRARVWLGLAVSLLFLLLLLVRVDHDELFEVLGAARPGWLVGAFAVYLIALWWRAWRWRLVLGEAIPLRTMDAYALVLIGYAANNVLPARAGELVRAQLIHDRHGGSRLVALGTIATERVADGLVLALFLLGTLALAGGNAALTALALVAGAGFIALAALLAALSSHANRPREHDRPAAGQRLLRLTPQRLRPRAGAWLERFLTGLTTVRGPRAWSLILTASVLTWGLEAAMYWMVGIALGLDLHPALYLGVCGAANLAVAVPASAGGIGPFEYFAREVVVRFGASTVAGTAYALALHALLLVPVVVIGAVLLWVRHTGPRAVLRAAAHAPVSPPAPAITTMTGVGAAPAGPARKPAAAELPARE